MKDRTCCLTGHRDIPKCMTKYVLTVTETAIRTIIEEHDVQHFCVGGALGFDSLAADILFQLRDSDYPMITVTLIYPFEGYTKHWSREEQERYTDSLSRYDNSFCVAQAGSKWAYLARDRELVDRSSFCIAYCTQDTGGTAYTIKYARQKGLRIINVALGNSAG